ncbi:MAG: 30S ribosomal protein S20 [Acidobacteria bacterium]|nr:MAG: 30S ribosomal protein S20 [Acidobacteriota bacterium]
MANHKSALKRLSQTGKRTERNRAHRTRMRHQIRELRKALDAKDKARAEGLLVPTLSMLDRMIQKGILHRNTAARYKSRLRLSFNSLA